MLSHATPMMLEHTETGAAILYGWSPYTPGAIRFDVNCQCGWNRLELIAPSTARPLDYVCAAVDFHRTHFPDCECLANADELNAHLN